MSDPILTKEVKGGAVNPVVVFFRFLALVVVSVGVGWASAAKLGIGDGDWCLYFWGGCFCDDKACGVSA